MFLTYFIHIYECVFENMYPEGFGVQPAQIIGIVLCIVCTSEAAKFATMNPVVD